LQQRFAIQWYLARHCIISGQDARTTRNGQGNREQEESFGRFYFSSHTFKFFGSPTYADLYYLI
jgi:hypothetical protein